MEPDKTTGGPQKVPGRVGLRIGAIFAVIVALVAVGVVFRMISPSGRRPRAEQAAYAQKTPTFSGSSESLQRTVIVPTLDSPCPPNKNVIWCSSFQSAWNKIRDNVVRAPLQVVGAEEVAARLNQAKQSTSDLESDSFYATGGRIGEGIIDKIKKEMAAKFPSHPLPDLDQYAGGPEDRGILAYSYLTAKALFKYPFEQGKKGLAFTDSRGVKTEVEDFGCWPNPELKNERIRKQVDVLFYSGDGMPDLGEYAIDLCRYSRPYQVVVAAVRPRDSLAETLAHTRQEIERFRTSPYSKEMARLRTNDVVAVPEMLWKIEHHFSELIGRVVANANPAMPILEALQTTEFKLDRSGAAVKSEALIVIKATPREFIFNRPFLVYMQKRGAGQPFFVMWVDNAELLTRK